MKDRWRIHKVNFAPISPLVDISDCIPFRTSSKHEAVNIYVLLNRNACDLNLNNETGSGVLADDEERIWSSVGVLYSN